MPIIVEQSASASLDTNQRPSGAAAAKFDPCSTSHATQAAKHDAAVEILATKQASQA
jgi:hypothetical protein